MAQMLVVKPLLDGRTADEDLCDFTTRCVSEARELKSIRDLKVRRKHCMDLFRQALTMRRESEQYATALGALMLDGAGLRPNT